RWLHGASLRFISAYAYDAAASRLGRRLVDSGSLCRAPTFRAFRVGGPTTGMAMRAAPFCRLNHTCPPDGGDSGLRSVRDHRTTPRPRWVERQGIATALAAVVDDTITCPRTHSRRPSACLDPCASWCAADGVTLRRGLERKS